MAKKSDKMIGSGDREPEAIRADIDKTRRRMSRTVEEIEEKFSPEHMKAIAKSTLKEQTVGRAGRMAKRAREGVMGMRSNMYEVIRENPLPAALVGLGLSWLIAESFTSSGRGMEPSEEYGEYGEYGERGERHHYSEKAGELAEKARQRAGEMGGQMREYGGRAKMKAMQGYGAVRGRFSNMLEENPLALAAVTLAVGAAIGLSMPSSEKEREYFGQAAEKFKEKMQTEPGWSTQQAGQMGGQSGRESMGEYGAGAIKEPGGDSFR